MNRILILMFILLFCNLSRAQEKVEPDIIRSVKLYQFGNQITFPLIPLGNTEGLELHFDDMSNRVKNYYYTYQLCDADWTPAILHSFEYIKGFQNVRITNYRNSSISTFRYVHYQAILPDRSSYPSKSGNYLLKVFLDNDTSKLVFTRRFVVTDKKAAVAVQIHQPFKSSLFKTSQRLNIVVQTDNRIQVMSPTDIKVVILQNNNFKTSLFINRPTIYRGNYYEYSDEEYTAMPAGKEFRWIDLRSLRLMSDRMQDIDTRSDTTQVYVKPDANRSGQVYVFYRDLDGSYTIEAMENINPLWQGDYAMVHFSYFPPGNRPIDGNDVYLFGEFTNYATDTSSRMTFNPDRGAYEKSMLLKQGFYNYNYITQPKGAMAYPDFSYAEGNYYVTENNYIVLVYYRPFGARSDEVLGMAQLNSNFR